MKIKVLAAVFWIIFVSNTESVRPHSAAVEKVSPKLNLPEGVLDDPTNETETPNEQISPDKGVVPADPTNSPVEDPSKVASATGSSPQMKRRNRRGRSTLAGCIWITSW